MLSLNVLIFFRVSNPHVRIRFVHIVIRHCHMLMLSLDYSRDPTVSKRFILTVIPFPHIQHARIYVHSHSFLYVTFGSFLSIHCISSLLFDLRIYTISDTTLHALVLFRDRWIAIYITETIGRVAYPGIHLFGQWG